MKAKVALFQTHKEAIDALQKLDDAGFPMKHVSLIGKAEVVDDHLHVKNLEPLKNAPVLIGTSAGLVAGLLTGMGVFAIPGFGFLYGAGALVGALAGFDIGLAGGGFATLLATAGIQKDHVIAFEEHVNEGKFLVIVNGPIEEVDRAEHILHTEGAHLEL